MNKQKYCLIKITETLSKSGLEIIIKSNGLNSHVSLGGALQALHYMIHDVEKEGKLVAQIKGKEL